MTSQGEISRPIRLWPAVLIVAVAAGALAWIWLSDAPDTQSRVVPTFPVLFLAATALFFWLVLFSALPRRLRGATALAVAAIAGLGFAVLEIRGVDGNLVPIVGLRGGRRSFEAAPGATTLPTPTGRHDYPQFYGPLRSATLAGPLLARDWGARAPRELWRRELGAGWSSFAVVGSAAVTQEQRGEEELVVRYELRTGQQSWVHADPAPFVTTIGGSGPRATPTIENGHVFTLGATGILNCLDLESGRRIWSRNVLQDHAAGQPDWGMASSPLVVGSLVMIQLGPGGTGLAAYDRATGMPAWRVGEDAGTYSSPLLATVCGVEQVLVVYHTSVTGHDPGTGAILWRHDWPNPGGERVTMPLAVGEDRLLVSAGYGVGSRLLRVVRDGARFTTELVWDSPRLKSKFAPMVIHDGVVYGLDDGVLVALDLTTGERRWKAGRYGHGQLVRVGDLLVIQAEGGDVVLVEANPERHVELGKLPALSGKTWNPPALSGSLLLVRNDREAAAYELVVEH